MRIDDLAETMTEFSERPALWLAGRTYRYDELLAAANRVQEALSVVATGAAVGILADRSFAAYAGIIGAMLSGRPYVPLNVSYPLERLRRVCASAALGAILGDPSHRHVAENLSLGSPLPLIFLCNEEGEVSTGGAAAELAGTTSESCAHPGNTAYIMFTSGTTGEPKGIAISRSNLSAYLDGTARHFDFRPSDRVSQFFSLSFDLSVHDMFVTWMTGGCLFVPDETELMDPVGFARKHELSVWFSVPSAASLAMRFRKLTPGCLPSLRHVLFCGEALSGKVAKAFAGAAPNAALTNLYGPTEATIAITAHRIRDLDAATVPIGHALPGQETLVLRSDGTEAGIGEVGELWLGGSQIAAGYTNNPEQTVEKFRNFVLPHRESTRWYATGDLVERCRKDGLVYRGRKDDQIKLNGHRIELTEVEEALREAAGTPVGVVAPWPVAAPRQLVAVICRPQRSETAILERMRQTLPDFMVPSAVRTVETMSFNTNGKLDRKRTLQRLAAS